MNLFTRIICIALLLTALTFAAFQVPIKSQSASVDEVNLTKLNTIYNN